MHCLLPVDGGTGTLQNRLGRLSQLRHRQGLQGLSGSPGVLSGFQCGWLLAPYMCEELKPERCHVVFCQPYDNTDTIVVNCDPRAPDAWRTPHVMEMLYPLARVFPQRIVLVQVENRYWRILEADCADHKLTYAAWRMPARRIRRSGRGLKGFLPYRACMPTVRYRGSPMTLANMRQQGDPRADKNGGRSPRQAGAGDERRQLATARGRNKKPRTSNGGASVLTKD
jgi:hypothetical protein